MTDKARGTVPGEPDDTVTKAVVYARTALEDACRLIETGDARLLASDGPAGDRPPELSLAEWRKLYVTLDKARKRLWAIASRIVAARGEASESRSVGALDLLDRARSYMVHRSWCATMYTVPGICGCGLTDLLEELARAALDGVRAGERPEYLKHIWDYAHLEVSMGRLAELLGVNIAEVQFLDPLTREPPVPLTVERWIAILMEMPGLYEDDEGLNNGAGYRKAAEWLASRLICRGAIPTVMTTETVPSGPWGGKCGKCGQALTPNHRCVVAGA